MRLLVFNLAMAADDPALAFAAHWVAALARRVERIHVLTMRAGRVDLPPNVHVYSVGKERGYSEARRAILFYRHISRILQQDRIDACFSHMIPEFTVLAAPLLWRKHIPIVTWYAHPSVTWWLRVAHHLSVCMVTSVAPAYPYRHDKLIVVGQGIDTELFSPGPPAPEEPPLILCVGRLSPVKEHPVLLRAAARLRQTSAPPFRLVILGAPVRSQDESYVQSLREEISSLGLGEMVRLAPAVPLADLPAWYRRCTIHVNLSRTGFGDKVALEAMSCARPSVVANEGFKATLGIYASDLLFRHGDPEDLAGKLRALLQASSADRDRVGRYLREEILRQHSLDGLTERLVGILRGDTRRNSRGG